MSKTKVILCGIGIGSTAFAENSSNVLDLTTNQNWKKLGVDELSEVVISICERGIFEYILVPIFDDGIQQFNTFLLNRLTLSVVVKDTSGLIDDWIKSENTVIGEMYTVFSKDEFLSESISELTDIKI